MSGNNVKPIVIGTLVGALIGALLGVTIGARRGSGGATKLDARNVTSIVFTSVALGKQIVDVFSS